MLQADDSPATHDQRLADHGHPSGLTEPEILDSAGYCHPTIIISPGDTTRVLLVLLEGGISKFIKKITPGERQKAVLEF